ncbi:MAG: DUF4864 domain-containing protein [Chthoniobacterales bacterium]
MTRTIKASLLSFFFALCFAAALVTHQIRRQIAPPAPHQLFTIVEQHLAAFRAADYSSIYRQAASGVQQKFSFAEYQTMMRRDYGHLTPAERIEFGSVTINGSAAAVQVFVREPSGSVRAFLYTLVAEDGSWKISGVGPIPPHARGLHI